MLSRKVEYTPMNKPLSLSNRSTKSYITSRTVCCSKRGPMNDDVNLRGVLPSRVNLVSNRIEYMVPRYLLRSTINSICLPLSLFLSINFQKIQKSLRKLALEKLWLSNDYLLLWKTITQIAREMVVYLAQQNIQEKKKRCQSVRLRIMNIRQRGKKCQCNVK